MRCNLIIVLITFLSINLPEVAANSFSIDPAEKVYLNTNQPYYVSGDIIEFSAYVISYLTFKPSGTSEVLHISLWNSDKELILKKKVLLKDGFGSGSIEIPKKLSSGNYMLAANTNWMLNFKELQYSKMIIGIINPNEGKKEVVDQPFSAAFFPEGGQIISGHLNQVAFQTNDTENEMKGVVVTEHSDTVSLFSSYKLGYGKFSFFANDTSNYEVIIEHNGNHLRYPLSKARNNAVSLKLINNNSDTLTVFANIGQQFKGEKLELLIQNKGEIILGTEQGIVGNRIKFLIPKSLLGNGLNQLVALNDQNTVISERLYFKEKPSVLECKITLGEPTFQPNKTIVMPLMVKSKSAQDKDINLSISVRNTKYFGASDLNPIDYSVNLFSEIDFTPRDPRFIQSVNDSLFLDIFLMTREMDVFSLKESKVESANRETLYAIEKAQKVLISGRVKDKETNASIKNSTIFCSVIGTIPQFFAAKTNDEGYFRFEIRPFEGQAEVILKLADIDETKSNINYELDQNLPKIVSNDFTDNIPVDSVLLRNYIDFKRQNLIIKRIYTPGSVVNSNERAAPVNEGFFLNYTYERDFQNYITLNDFKEMARELIPGIVIKGENAAFKIYLKEYDKKNDYLIDPFPNEPLILIDGMPVFDSREILNFNPENVKMVRLINNRFSVNGTVFDGIFEMTTVGGDYYKNLKSNHMRYILEGFTPSRSAGNEQLLKGSSSMDKLPDFRSVLYWNPNINMKTNQTKNIEFSTSDDTGDFLVDVKGVDGDGNLFNYQTIIQVME
jgi:hypothetical protein